MNKNNVRLIVWGLLFAITFACGVIGLVTYKTKQRVTVYDYDYNYQE